jgi:hypothetical protein
MTKVTFYPPTGNAVTVELEDKLTFQNALIAYNQATGSNLSTDNATFVDVFSYTDYSQLSLFNDISEVGIVIGPKTSKGGSMSRAEIMSELKTSNLKSAFGDHCKENYGAHYTNLPTPVLTEAFMGFFNVVAEAEAVEVVEGVEGVEGVEDVLPKLESMVTALTSVQIDLSLLEDVFSADDCDSAYDLIEDAKDIIKTQIKAEESVEDVPEKIKDNIEFLRKNHPAFQDRY